MDLGQIAAACAILTFLGGITAWLSRQPQVRQRAGAVKAYFVARRVARLADVGRVLQLMETSLDREVRKFQVRIDTLIEQQAQDVIASDTRDTKLKEDMDALEDRWRGYIADLERRINTLEEWHRRDNESILRHQDTIVQIVQQLVVMNDSLGELMASMQLKPSPESRDEKTLLRQVIIERDTAYALRMEELLKNEQGADQG